MSPDAPSNATSTSTSKAACRACAAAGWHQPQSALVEHEASLEEYFLKHPPRSAKQAQAVIEQQTGIRRGLSQVRHFLKDRLGLRWRKTGAIPVPAQEDGRGARPGAGRLPARRSWSRGWSRPAGAAGRCTSWTPPTSCSRRSWAACGARRGCSCGRPRAASGTTSWGRCDAVTHRLIRVTNHGYINAESVCTLLRSVAAAGVGLPITLVLDNARYQKCAVVQALAASLGIELLYLPSYSPNLNLIERLWRFVRKQSLDSTYYEDFEQFTAAIDECLDGLPTVHKGEMETLMTHKFQMFEDVPLLAA